MGGDTGDVATGIDSSKNAVENNYLNSSDHQDKVGLEYKEKKGELTDKEKLKLAELRAKNVLNSEALLEACVDVSSEACRVERQKAYDALRTYRVLTYEKPPEKQTGYQEIQHLLEGTSNTPEANELRARYNGLVETFKRWGYDEEDAQAMAGRTIGTMMILYGVNGTITMPKINKVLNSSKLLAAGKGTNRSFDELPLVKPRSIDKIDPAPGQFVLDKTSVTKLKKEEVYIYIIDANNNIKIAPRGSAGRTGVKHTQLSGGEPVKGAGELKMNSDGTLSINNQSGRYRAQSSNALKKLESHLSNMNIKTKSTSEVIN